MGLVRLAAAAEPNPFVSTPDPFVSTLGPFVSLTDRSSYARACGDAGLFSVACL